jgi:hypothetical protein
MIDNSLAFEEIIDEIKDRVHDIAPHPGSGLGYGPGMVCPSGYCPDGAGGCIEGVPIGGCGIPPVCGSITGG